MLRKLGKFKLPNAVISARRAFLVQRLDVTGKFADHASLSSIISCIIKRTGVGSVLFAVSSSSYILAGRNTESSGISKLSIYRVLM